MLVYKTILKCSNWVKNKMLVCLVSVLFVCGFCAVLSSPNCINRRYLLNAPYWQRLLCSAVQCRPGDNKNWATVTAAQRPVHWRFCSGEKLRQMVAPGNARKSPILNILSMVEGDQELFSTLMRIFLDWMWTQGCRENALNVMNFIGMLD